MITIYRNNTLEIYFFIFFGKLFFLFVFVHILGKMQKGDQARGSRNINWMKIHLMKDTPF